MRNFSPKKIGRFQMFLETTKKIPMLCMGVDVEFAIPDSAEVRYFGDGAPIATLKRDSSGAKAFSKLPENCAIIVSHKDSGTIFGAYVNPKKPQEVLKRFSKGTTIIDLATSTAASAPVFAQVASV